MPSLLKHLNNRVRFYQIRDGLMQYQRELVMAHTPVSDKIQFDQLLAEKGIGNHRSCQLPNWKNFKERELKWNLI